MKNIYITTDIHNYLPNSYEHQSGFFKETEYLKEYLKIANKYDLKITVFVSGKEVENNIKYYKKLTYDKDIELGGHTYDCFTKYYKGEGYLYKKIYGCAYGPKSLQKQDIEKTTSVLTKLGIHPISWRTHAYSSNRTTRRILKDNGYKIISDLNNKIDNAIKIMECPPNTLPDHENIIHKGIKNTFAKFTIEQWLKKIQLQIKNNEKSIILAHATCQKYIDDFETLKELFEWIYDQNYESKLMKDLVK
ncbi:peptidoglycan/xylan/chitin deacetylase (PgdA/CDA1 family) [Methanococcus maripaludis]|uniref:Peptidoglycan/xylan/chitin deacetylase (PgdA/CDA1 family) n=1 Tax=Methanococcus maripaludis TaxID=39152 RepID=A0A7J9NHM2_METMI|nr:polysaccharide deacetylase family protein [Methanococcus maripaludis]MBA2840127.1 peptidoglycan/xylan/chitin deacetylase (PgdA/CDA1 family) [Methanococcus maripaludis]